MAEADVGDDVFGDDPTVIALEERAADLLGKEAALFVPSGTMANLVAQMAHLERGAEAIAGVQSHVVMDEAAGHAVIVGASVRSLRETPDGTLYPAEVRAAFRDPGDVHEPLTGLVLIENTHAHSGGRPLDPAYTRTIAGVAHEGGVPLHVDGARLFNAAVALGVPARDLVADADSAGFCLSKGLACPVGSLVVGSRDFIWKARRARKMVGGGMRQVGVLAAPGLIALRDGAAGMIERLADDHANARAMARALSAMPGIVSPGGSAQPEPGALDPDRVLTNFVLFRVERDRGAFVDAARARGLLVEPYPGAQVRAVTHYGISAADIEAAVAIIGQSLADTPLRPVAA